MQRPTGVTVLAALYIFTAGILGLTSVVLIFGRTLLEGIKGPADVANLGRATQTPGMTRGPTLALERSPSPCPGQRVKLMKNAKICS